MNFGDDIFEDFEDDIFSAGFTIYTFGMTVTLRHPEGALSQRPKGLLAYHSHENGNPEPIKRNTGSPIKDFEDDIFVDFEDDKDKYGDS